MTVSKNPTSYKLSLEVENGVNAIGAMQTKSASLGSCAFGSRSRQVLHSCRSCWRPDEARDCKCLRY